MTEQEFNSIKLPALVFPAHPNYTDEYGMKISKEFIVCCKHEVYLGVSSKIEFNENAPKATWWHYRNINIVQEDYFDSREIMLEIENIL